MAKRFFYVCAGLLMLAAAYHLGATNAESQAPGNPVVAAVRDAAQSWTAVFTANGDVYQNQYGLWTYAGNVFSSATAAKPETWGGVKERFGK
jgi:hypothetical protein